MAAKSILPPSKPPYSLFDLYRHGPNEASKKRTHAATTTKSISDYFSKEPVTAEPPNKKTKQSNDSKAKVSTEEKKFKPFWKPRTTEESKKWWIPTRSNSSHVSPALWNGRKQNIDAKKSWFTFKMTQTNHPVVTDNTVAQLSCNKVEETKGWKVWKVRLLPNTQQDQILKKWMGAARWTYNQGVAFLLQNAKSRFWHSAKLLKHFREQFINKESPLVLQNPWVLEIPYDVRDEAARDLTKAVSSTLQLLKSGHIKHFKMQFRSKKKDTSSISVLKKHWKDGKLFPRSLGKSSLNSFEHIPPVLPGDCRMYKTRTGKYYLCLLKPLDRRPENQGPSPRALIIDPGVRTFLTGYDPSGYMYEWGAGDMKRLYRLRMICSKLQSRSSEVCHNKRYKMQRAMRRIYDKMKNLIADIHRKSIKWIVENFTYVLLPKFDSSQMVKRNKRKIGKRTAWEMLAWRPYRFRTRLQSKVQEYPWCHVSICTEEYTSKTCGCCGAVNTKLGAKKVFSCVQCGYKTDRDFNGARNIWLKELTKKSDGASVGKTKPAVIEA